MTPEQATVILNFLLPTVEREVATTKKVLSAVPDGKGDYTPDPVSMKALDLAWHIASADNMFASGVAAGVFETGGDGKRPAEMDSAAKIAAWYEEKMAANCAAVKGLTPEECTKIIDFHGIFQMPAVAWLQLLLGHSIHHRGQLSAYLRPMGAKVPSIYGPSADEPLQSAASS
jgi:uncharacterized damage-inducible protein DinB